MNVAQAFTISAVAKRITYETSYDALIYASNTTCIQLRRIRSRKCADK